MPSLKCYLFEPVRGAMTPFPARHVSRLPEERRHEAVPWESHQPARGRRPGLAVPAVRVVPGIGARSAAVPRTVASGGAGANTSGRNRALAPDARQADAGGATAIGTHHRPRTARRNP